MNKLWEDLAQVECALSSLRQRLADDPSTAYKQLIIGDLQSLEQRERRRLLLISEMKEVYREP
jgi:hypothetical protein